MSLLVDYFHPTKFPNQVFSLNYAGLWSYTFLYSNREVFHLVLHFSSLLGPATNRMGIAIAKVALKGMATSLPNEKPQPHIEVMIMMILSSIAILALQKCYILALFLAALHLLVAFCWLFIETWDLGCRKIMSLKITSKKSVWWDFNLFANERRFIKGSDFGTIKKHVHIS